MKTKINRSKIVICAGVSLLVLVNTNIGIYKLDQKFDHEKEECFITKITHNINHQIEQIKDHNSSIKEVEYIEDYQDMYRYLYEHDENGELVKEELSLNDEVKLEDGQILITIYKDKYSALKISYMDKDMFITEEKILKLEKKY